jgi:hypothetical protein
VSSDIESYITTDGDNVIWHMSAYVAEFYAAEIQALALASDDAGMMNDATELFDAVSRIGRKEGQT